MQITLDPNSDVPLRQQLAEQIVFLIRTGQFLAGQELPNVRALERQCKVNRNTVSEAYQELVRRGWLTRHRGSRLVVGKRPGAPLDGRHSLDELINESIQRARNMGYTLQALRQRVRERLLAQPPDHILVVEQESGLREIVGREIQDSLRSLRWPVESCSREEFVREPSLAIGAQVLVANQLFEELKPLIPQSTPPIATVCSRADEHVALIRQLQNPSIVAVVSVSAIFLKTARSLLAPAIGRRHTLREVLLAPLVPINLEAVDLVFCDSIAVPMVRSRHKVHYRLIANDCLEHLAASLGQH
jgi:DNA-binding transcriptional regulator YhcF (GntR family)